MNNLMGKCANSISISVILEVKSSQTTVDHQASVPWRLGYTLVGDCIKDLILDSCLSWGDFKDGGLFQM